MEEKESLYEKLDLLKKSRGSEEEETNKLATLFLIFLKSEPIPASCNCMNELKHHVFKMAREKEQKGCKLSHCFLQIFPEKKKLVNGDWGRFLSDLASCLDQKNAIFYSLAGCCHLEGLGQHDSSIKMNISHKIYSQKKNC